MKSFKQFILDEEVRRTMSNFSDILNNNPDLKNAIDLCRKIESLEPNAEALVVGGSVRDILLNKKPKDIDIATNVDIDKIVSNFKTADIGQSKDFGIVAVLFNGGVYEVAHYREDVYQGNTDARHPSDVKFSNTFKTDSERRDITINSLGLSTNGEIIDYQGGLDDLKNQIIRAVGSPKDRFIEDALRMMRVGRFMARYGFKIDDNTRNAIIELKDTIKKISPERIRDELFKAASSGASLANYIEHLKDVGLLKLILPEIDVMDQYEHSPEHHPEGNVFQHTMGALRQSKSNDPITNMAIMFHDLGKPASRTYSDTGSVQYHGHEKAGIDVFNAVSNRLKLSNEEKEAIKFAIEYHMVGHHITDLKKSKILSLRQNKNWDLLRNVLWSDDASRQGAFEPKYHLKNMEEVEKILQQFGEKEAFEKRMNALVNGQLIMSLIPKIKGKDIGSIKEQTREWVIQRDFNVTKEEVARFITDRAAELGY